MPPSMALSENSNKTAAASLLALSLLAIWGTWGIGGRTGFLALIKDALEAPIQRLPVVNEPVKQFYTGIGPADYFVRRLNIFLWPAIDGTWPGLCLVAWELNGQFSAAWLIAGIEGLRHGNRGKLISYTTIFGLIAQALTFGVTVPIYLSLHLLTSPTTLSSDPSAFLIDPAPLLAWPLAFTLSYLLPTLLVTLPSLSYSIRQTFMAFWDLYPLGFKLLQLLLIPLLPSSNPKSKATTLRLTSYLYAYAALLSAIPHLITLTLSITPVVFPELFTPAARSSLSFANIFVPVKPWHSNPVEHLGGGLWRFLVWNLLISGGAPMVWAGWRLVGEGGGTGKGEVVGKMAALAIVGGPGAATAWAAWEREKIVLGAARIPEKSE
ncbi:MAG: hypothetical protein Q9195_003504 [Heterodermia aff. obscurata]